MKAAAALALAVIVSPCLVAASDPSVARLEQQLAYLARTTDATVGVAALHIESGRYVSLNGTQRFPQASAVKVPIAVQIMALADAGQLSLGKMITLTPSDLHPGSGRITDLLFHPGVALSIENIMELAIVISDNSAADLMLREAGGPAAVTERMKVLGLDGIRVDRSIAKLLADWGGIRMLPPETEWTRDMWDRLFAAVPEAEHMAARRIQTRDPRDTATPADMTKLLARIYRKDMFSPTYATRLWEVMERCQTGRSRLRGMLPEGTDVAHKTGSMGGVVNDVGVMTLPGKAGHVAISVFTKGSARPEEVSERTVAEISRTIYDYFTLVPAVTP
ncbi:MAG TPA: class A beta-lactamase [Bryobacteraceae bacterium]|nr:class A beta-lactamase [Bryobacteraceae bacterium]